MEIYKKLIHIEGFPKIIYYKKLEEYFVMIVDMLGENLEKLFWKYRKFSLESVCRIGIQMVDRIEQVHKAGYLHWDIKPDNFLIGLKNDAATIYCIDFGLCKKFMKKGEHIKMIEGKSLIGTARYASINAHAGLEQGRRDDLESIGYMLIYFLRDGKLPW